MEIRARHFLGQNAQQVHHIAKAELQLIGRPLFCLGEDAVHGIVRDLGVQPAERQDRRLRRDVKPFELHIRIRHQIDIGAAVHAALGNLEHFAVIRQIAVAVERAEVDERVRLQAVVQTVDRQRAAAAADEQECLVVIIDIKRRRFDMPDAGFDIAGQDIVDKIVMRAGQNGLLVLGAENAVPDERSLAMLLPPLSSLLAELAW